jgi:hypothetical protein
VIDKRSGRDSCQAQLAMIDVFGSWSARGCPTRIFGNYFPSRIDVDCAVFDYPQTIGIVAERRCSGISGRLDKASY